MIRVGIIGMGFGRYGLIPAFRRDPRCTISAICSRTEATREKYRCELNVAASFARATDLVRSRNVDAVAIATSPKDQSAIARLAIAEGKHVFAEKPLANTAHAAAALAAAAHQKNIAHVVDFIFPELTAFRAARTVLDTGVLGRVRHAHVEWLMHSFDHAHALTTWKTDVDAGGGLLRHFGSHVLYYLQYLLGEIITVDGSHSRASDISTPGDTFATFAVRFASSASAAVVLSSVAATAPSHRIVIHGATGWLSLENTSTDPVRGFVMRTGSHGSASPTQTATDAANTYVRGVDSRVPAVARLTSRFLDWVLHGTTTHPNFADGAHIQILLERVRPLVPSITTGAHNVPDPNS